MRRLLLLLLTSRPRPRRADRLLAFICLARLRTRLFRLLSSDEFRTRTQQAMLQEIAYGVQLRAGNYTIFRDSNPDEKKRGDVLRAHGFATMLRPNMDRLPDMDFAIIGLAEVRPPRSRPPGALASLAVGS